MMNREIPGFYYDPEKKRYFRIESSHTTPPNAAWSSREVAKRRRAAAEAENDASKRRHGARSALRGEPERVKRRWCCSPPFSSSFSPLSSSQPPWGPEPILGFGLLAREVSGCARGGDGRQGEAARMAETVLPRAWAAGLMEKGSVRPWPEHGDGRARGGVVDFWAGPDGNGGDDEREIGVVYAVFEGGEVAASYVPRDREDRINFRYATERYPALSFRPTYYPQPRGRVVSSIGFHEPSSTMLLACQNTGGVVIGHFHPDIREGSPAWVLPGGTDNLTIHEAKLAGDRNFTGGIHTLQPAPTGSPLLCVVGTDKGILQLRPDGSNPALAWLTPPPPPPGWQKQHHHDPPHRKPRGGKGYRHNPSHSSASSSTSPYWHHGTVLSLDFSPQNPSSLLLAGTRSGRVALLDLRVPAHQQWKGPQGNGRAEDDGVLSIAHASSAAHVRCVGPHDVLVAGPRNAMAVYDVRWLKQQRQRQQEQQKQWHTQQKGPQNQKPNGPRWSSLDSTNPWPPQRGGGGGGGRGGNPTTTTPILTFPAYRNEAHIHIGLDVLTSPGYGYGYGYGEAPGGSCSFSALSHGRGRGGVVAAAHDDGTVGLYSLVDGTRLGGGAVDGFRSPGAETGAVVRKLAWRTLPGDRHPSLLVAKGEGVDKFSFWA
ncbi:hypothetical protein VTJ83DRAFT_6748 [Remersonia thermophila]|uniref:Myocyte-specific enhancer factor 2d n=1 Tax=Remersonia thermophila TaxID=72144 RepID=A0ABR4D5N1_9PEZI